MSLKATAYSKDGSSRDLGDTLRAPSVLEPEASVLRAAEDEAFKDWIAGALMVREQSAVTAYLAGCSYREIAQANRWSCKTVDYPLQRIKQKLARRSKTLQLSA